MPLTPVEKQWIRDRVEVQPVLQNVTDVELIVTDLVPDFREAQPTSPASDAEVKAAAAAYALGPKNAGPVPDEVVSDLAGDPAAGFGTLDDLPACEWAVAKGCLRPPAPPVDWEHRWDRAWELLVLGVVPAAIYNAVQWFGHRVKGLDGQGLQSWTHYEVHACAALICGALVDGCDCWQRDADFHVREGVVRCQEEHDLANWNPLVTGMSLHDFVWRAAVKGELRLAGNGKPEVALVNDARKGMLSRVVDFGSMVAGPVLRCSRMACRSDVALQDECVGVARHISHQQPIEDTSWWFWVKGERLLWWCRRCTSCRGLYFRYHECCMGPHGEEQETRWSERLTEVWVPRSLLGNLPPDVERLADYPLSPLQEALPQDHPALKAAIDFFQGDARTVVEILFLHGGRIDAVRNQLDPPPPEEDFEQIQRVIVHVLKTILDEGIPYWRALQEAIAGMKQPQREVAELIYVRGYPNSEAAARLGFTSRADKAKYRRIAASVARTLRERTVLAD